MTQPPLSPIDQWIETVSELPTQSDNSQMMAVKAMAAVLSKEPDHEQIQQTLDHFEAELSLSRQFDKDKTDLNSDIMHHILSGLPFILRKLAGEIKGPGEISIEAQSVGPLALSNEREGEDDEKDFFPFLSLPDELLAHTFSFLSMKDRSSARVNRRLNKIESEYKYHVDKLLIEEGSEVYIASIKERSKDHIIGFITGRSYSSICIKRLTQNLSVGDLYIELNGSSDFHREVYNLIMDFNIGKLQLQFWDPDLENEIMVDSYFLDLSRSCKQLDLMRVYNITPNALHQVYKMMMYGLSKLCEVIVDETNNQTAPFLDLIGITYRDNRFFTNRDIEGFEYRHFDYYEIHCACLFDGNLEIGLQYLLDSDEDGTPIWKSGKFALKLHDSKESLDEAKKFLIEEEYERIEFVPE